MIKYRDFWMPFTPSILIERQHDYLKNPKNIDARFMTVALKQLLWRIKIPACLHQYDLAPTIDYEETNPEYHALVTAFQKITNVGAL